MISHVTSSYVHLRSHSISMTSHFIASYVWLLSSCIEGWHGTEVVVRNRPASLSRVQERPGVTEFVTRSVTETLLCHAPWQSESEPQCNASTIMALLDASEIELTIIYWDFRKLVSPLMRNRVIEILSLASSSERPNKIFKCFNTEYKWKWLLRWEVLNTSHS